MRQAISLCLLLLLALALRVGWSMHLGNRVDTQLPDQNEYLQLAGNLLHGNGMVMSDPHFENPVYGYRMPGYPLLVAACRANVLVIRLLQAILDTSTVFAIYILARRWLAPGDSLFAALLIALNPFLIYFSGLILSETLFIAMLAWAMVLLVWRRDFIWGAALIALSVLVRPGAILLPIVLAIAGIFARSKLDQNQTSARNPSPVRLPVGATSLLLTFIVLFPWAWRNKNVLGEWVWLTTNEGITRYDGFNPDATGASNQDFVHSPSVRHLTRVSDATSTPLPEVQHDRYFSMAAMQWIRDTWREHPRRLIDLTAHKIARTWSPIPLSSEYGTKPLYVWIAILYSIPFDVLVVVGLCCSPLSKAAKVFLLIPALYLTAIHAATVGSLRYRLPAEPPMALLAASSATLFNRRRDSGRVE